VDKLTMILQDAPYGSEKAYNAFRYASALLANQVAVNLFLLADGVGVAKLGQKTPTGTTTLQACSVSSLQRASRSRLVGRAARPGALANKNSSKVSKWGE
jgi:uncharacterized protein involved in oxidation of intracellular sulfur